MKLRTIMIFPEFDNMDHIDNIRNQYDPLASLVRPHITLVFPFESPLSNEELSNILENRLQTIKPFPLKLGGISKQEDTFGNYLFLDVLQGAEEICSIHEILYKNEFKQFDMDLPYIPHMTIGKLPDAQLLNDAYHAVKNFSDVFCTTVDKISVETIGDNEESIIVIEKKLH